MAHLLRTKASSFSGSRAAESSPDPLLTGGSIRKLLHEARKQASEIRPAAAPAAEPTFPSGPRGTQAAASRASLLNPSRPWTPQLGVRGNSGELSDLLHRTRTPPTLAAAAPPLSPGGRLAGLQLSPLPPVAGLTGLPGPSPLNPCTLSCSSSLSSSLSLSSPAPAAEDPFSQQIQEVLSSLEGELSEQELGAALDKVTRLVEAVSRPSSASQRSLRSGSAPCGGSS
eukprot:RCo006154